MSDPFSFEAISRAAGVPLTPEPDYEFPAMKAAFGGPAPEPVPVGRIDHAAEADRLLASFQTENRPAEAAQAHATLALAEQQRIANLIALSAVADLGGDPATRLDDLRVGLAGEVWEGLGLS
ncbi:hypothetical protein [Agromyces sp. NPDC058064]|uniref:hypothetical protein n=1 Tax=Agromyces sp. NPDC058064 TaxID=3346322 RepID=UPI0036DF31BF